MRVIRVQRSRGFIKASVKKLFFDRQAVISAMDKATHRTLRYAGGLIRRIARSSIRYKPDKTKHAPPGRPPHSHIPRSAKFQGIRHIFFYYEPTIRTVIIGPVGPVRWRWPTVPHVLEFGGTGPRRKRRAKFRIGQRGPIRMQGRRLIYGRLETSAQVKRAYMLFRKQYPLRPRIKARPYMKPALDKAVPRVMQTWRNSL